MTHPLAAQRLERLRRSCDQAGIRTLIVYGNAWTCDYLRYATDFASLEGHAVAVVTRESTRLFVESQAEAERARAEAGHNQIEWLPDFWPLLRQALASAEGLAAAPWAHLPRGLSAGLGPAAIDFTAGFQQLLMHKLDGEIEAVRRAAALADEGYEVFRHAAREGRTEYEVVAELEGFFRARGCPDNFMIMASGGREVRAMHPPGHKRLQRGDLVTTELTPCVDGYYAQICRTLVIGPPSAEQQQAFDVHLEALEAGMAMLKPGLTAGELAQAQNDVFRRHGLGDYVTSEYTRVRGHGLGLYVDSRPAILEDDRTVIADGTTLIVHPNGYHPASGYLVLGDAVVVRACGNEVLTRTPRQLFVAA